MMQSRGKLNHKIVIALGAIIVFLILMIPWRNHVYSKNITDGKNELVARHYTLAFVKFEKARMLKPGSGETRDLMDLAKKSAGDVKLLRDLGDDDLNKAIDQVNSKICDLTLDRALIDAGKSDLAKINLLSCTQNSPTYDAWTLLGVANVRLSESSDIFKELKPDLQKEAAVDFQNAYDLDPLNEIAINDAIAINRTLGNQSEVDRWQKLLDNLDKIQK